MEKYKWKLIREDDDQEWFANDVKWIEWDNSNKVQASHDSINIGLSLILPPFNEYYQWMTTEVTEIIENTSVHIRFRTKNSIYILIKL